MRKKKIAILGAGNAGCITALHYYFYGKDIFDKITIYYDKKQPIERVGQGSTINIPSIINSVFDINFEDRNFINATKKEGILYENWGTKKEKIYHSFALNNISLHYVPNLLSNLVINSGFFDIETKQIDDPEKDIDCDFIFDCRGRHKRDKELYEELINPLNSVLLSRKEIVDRELFYTKTVATPDGWTFVIPNIDSTSYGYLYNKDITSFDEANSNFKKLFDADYDAHLEFENYIAKSCFVGERTILNGNRLSFLEPLEATSTDFYLKVCRYVWDYIVNGADKNVCNLNVRKEMMQIQNFVLWHYQFGSKYNTNFWNYAKSLPFNPDKQFLEMLDISTSNSFVDLKRMGAEKQYSQWSATSFKTWIDNIK